MNGVNLEPKALFDFFDEICKIPHESKHEEQISEYLKKFGEALGYETICDAAGNVLIKKPAYPGYENCKTVLLQGHMDMVCEKRSDVEHDFSKDPIATYIDGEWLKAKGTTLGADNGIGVAAAMAVLADKDMKHGPVNCLFTVDEETGLTGAEMLAPSMLDGDILINLDSEDEGEIFIGCAGGICTYADYKFMWTPIAGDLFFFKVDIMNLTGGHSGDDISKNRANANKLLVRFLCLMAEKYEFYLCDINGGNKHNAIPRDASAVFAVQSADKESVRIDFNLFAADVREEFSATEPNIDFLLQSTDAQGKAIERKSMQGLLKSLNAVFNGVFAMSQDVPGLVETSSNLASIKMNGGNVVSVVASQRSAIISARDNVAATVSHAFELGGAEVRCSGGYPGWKPNPKSEILTVAADVYRELFGEEVKVKAIHAGLECGLFLEKAPRLDMISFGPTMRGVHSPDEKLNIPSVAKFWKHLVALLERVPVKK